MKNSPKKGSKKLSKEELLDKKIAELHLETINEYDNTALHTAYRIKRPDFFNIGDRYDDDSY